jgi:hypothetical protein
MLPHLTPVTSPLSDSASDRPDARWRALLCSIRSACMDSAIAATPGAAEAAATQERGQSKSGWRAFFSGLWQWRTVERDKNDEKDSDDDDEEDDEDEEEDEEEDDGDEDELLPGNTSGLDALQSRRPRRRREWIFAPVLRALGCNCWGCGERSRIDTALTATFSSDWREVSRRRAVAGCGAHVCRSSHPQMDWYWWGNIIFLIGSVFYLASACLECVCEVNAR